MMWLCMLQCHLIKTAVDLQDDLSRIHDWSLRWQLKLSPNKCEALNITNKCFPIPLLITMDQLQ